MGNGNATLIREPKDNGESSWSDQEFVGDEQGMLHPRAEKRKPHDVIVVGSGMTRQWYGAIRAAGLLEHSALLGKSLSAFDGLEQTSRPAMRGHNKLSVVYDDYPFTASSFSEKPVRKKSNSQKKREQRKRTQASKRKNRK